MRRRWIRGLLAGGMALWLAGCAGGPHFGDAQGWSSGQKREFLRILEHDRYASLCGLEPTYRKYLQTRDSRLLSQLLVGYTRNLANSCIDMPSFKAAQRAREARKIHTKFTPYLQSVSAASLMAQLREGRSVESILKPYVPPMPQFGRLLTVWHGGGLDEAQRRKVRLSLERAKLMDPDPAHWRTYFLVNIPEFRVRFFENGRLAFVSDVIVGQKSWQTPIFSAGMKYVTLNPTWNVPDNIARAEEIPHLLRDPNYFKRKRMIVLRSYDLDSTPVNPRSVNWRKYLRPEWKKKDLPYKLIQLPAKGNALGRVKFLFPNSNSVYMHDTPAKSLFKRKIRAYSHGCIRLARPIEMLRYLAEHGYLNKAWPEVEKELKSWKRHNVGLREPIPVHVGYFTAYVSQGGGVQFFPDIYDYDRIMRLKKAQ
jgi:hypothetical protein